MNERDRGHDPRRGHDHQIRRVIVARVPLRIHAGGRPRLVERWSVLSLRLDAAHTPRLRVVTVTGMNRHLRAENVTASSLRLVMSAHLPHAVMIVGMRGEDEIFLCHQSRPGVMLAHAQGRLGPRCLSVPATADPVVGAIKKTWIYNVLLLIVITWSHLCFCLVSL